MKEIKWEYIMFETWDATYYKIGECWYKRYWESLELEVWTDDIEEMYAEFKKK